MLKFIQVLFLYMQCFVSEKNSSMIDKIRELCCGDVALITYFEKDAICMLNTHAMHTLSKSLCQFNEHFSITNLSSLDFVNF